MIKSIFFKIIFATNVLVIAVSIKLIKTKHFQIFVDKQHVKNSSIYMFDANAVTLNTVN